MDSVVSNVVYGGSGSRRPGAVWQRVSTAVWNTLKRIGDDEGEIESAETFLTPPDSPRHFHEEGLDNNYSISS